MAAARRTKCAGIVPKNPSACAELPLTTRIIHLHGRRTSVPFYEIPLLKVQRNLPTCMHISCGIDRHPRLASPAPGIRVWYAYCLTAFVSFFCAHPFIPADDRVYMETMELFLPCSIGSSFERTYNAFSGNPMCVAIQRIRLRAGGLGGLRLPT